MASSPKTKTSAKPAARKVSGASSTTKTPAEEKAKASKASARVSPAVPKSAKKAPAASELDAKQTARLNDARKMYGFRSKSENKSTFGLPPSVADEWPSVRQGMTALFEDSDPAIWRVIARGVTLDDGRLRFGRVSGEDYVLGATAGGVELDNAELKRVTGATFKDRRGGKADCGHRLYVALCAARGAGLLDGQRRLDLSGAEALGDLRPLSNLGALESLNLSRCSSLKHVDELSNMPALEQLDLSRCESLESVAGLRDLPVLRELSLAATGVSDLAPVAKIGSLRILDLSRVSEADRERAARKLPPLPRPSLAPLATLAGLELKLREWDIEGVDLSGLTGLVALDLASTNIRSLAPLTPLKKLRALDVSRCKKLNADLQLLSELPELASLTLTLESGTELPRLPRVTTLDIVVSFEPEAAREVFTKAIAAMPAVRGLTIRGLGEIESLLGLEAASDLELLTLERALSLTDISALRGAHKLRQLSIAYCSELKDLSALAKLTSLKSLELTRLNETADISVLGSLTNLESLTLSNTAALKDAKCLAPLKKLRRINLSSCDELNDIDSLRQLGDLEQIDLRDCAELESEAFEALRGALPKCTIITE
jgi:Leucine-rich repeat (LRR) protein